MAPAIKKSASCFGKPRIQLDNKCYKQLKAGAIGVGIAGDVANFFMVWLDKQIKLKLESEYISFQIYWHIIQRTANKICERIRVTIYFPSNLENGRMHVLDIEQEIGPVKINNVTVNQIPIRISWRALQVEV